MQLTAPQQCLIRLNQNLVCHLFLHDDRSLRYNTYSDNNTLLDSNELLSDVINFSVTLDNRERIHLVCITTKGELQHYINENNNWNYRTILRFDVKSNIYKYLTLYVDDECAHLLYVKTNLLTQTLSSIEHMYWNGKNVNRIVVSNYVHGKYTNPLQVSLDNSGNFHIVYKAFYKNNHQLYYNKFDILTKIWAINKLASNLQEEHSHPYLFIDRKQNLHLVWCTIEQNNFILKYKKKHNIIDMKPKWSNVQTLLDKNSNYLSPILIQESDTLKIYCKQNDKIIEIISDNFGDSWTNSMDKEPLTIEKPEIIRYFSNPQTIDNTYLAKHVYGNIGNTIQIIGINLFDNKKESQLPPIQSTPDQKQDSPVETDKENNTSEEFETDEGDDTEKSDDVIDKLISDYSVLEKQFFELREKNQKLMELINNYETDLELLEKEIAYCKKQMLILQEKFDKMASNDGVFQRFINFFR
ncbi:MAG: hypothetical protein ACOCG5_01945 [Candidatus Alkaliphilus sp. MAG34]